MIHVQKHMRGEIGDKSSVSVTLHFRLYWALWSLLPVLGITAPVIFVYHFVLSCFPYHFFFSINFCPIKFRSTGFDEMQWMNISNIVPSSRILSIIVMISTAFTSHRCYNLYHCNRQGRPNDLALHTLLDRRMLSHRHIKMLHHVCTCTVHIVNRAIRRSNSKMNLDNQIIFNVIHVYYKIMQQPFLL